MAKKRWLVPTFLFLLLLSVPLQAQVEYELVVPAEFQSVQLLDGTLAVLKKYPRMYYVNRVGETLASMDYTYDTDCVFYEGMAVASRYRGELGRSLWGFVDRAGKEVIPLQYDGAKRFCEGFAPVLRDGCWGFIDRTGKEVVPLRYEYVGFFSEGLVPVLRDGLYGVVDRTGKEVIPPSYSVIHGFRDGVSVVGYDVRSWRIVDALGETVVDLPYDYVAEFKEGMAVVSSISLGGMMGFMDSEGNLAVPARYDYAWDFSEGLALVSLGGMHGFVDWTGAEVIPLVYSYGSSFSNGLAVMRKAGVPGFVVIDNEGNEVLHVPYGYVGPFSEGVATVGVKPPNPYGFRDSNADRGCIDEEGNVVVPLIYDDIGAFQGGWAVVRVGNEYGIIAVGGIPAGLESEEDGTHPLGSWVFPLGASLAAASAALGMALAGR